MKDTFSLQDALAYYGAIYPGYSLPVIPSNVAGKPGKTPIKRVHYITGFLNQLGTVNGELLLQKNTEATGVRSINGNKLPAGTDFLVTRVRMLFDTTATVQSGGAGIEAANFGKTDAPVAYKNGELRFQQGTDLTVLTGRSTVNSKASTGNDDDFFPVSPFVWREDTVISIKAALAGNAAVDQAYCLEIEGFEFTDTDKK